MQKRITTTLFLIVLTLSVTQLASAQWMTNTVTNQTTETIYVVWSTAYPAVGDVPEAGYRTSGWVNLLPGQREGFWGFSTHRVYFLILRGSDPIKPDLSTDTVSSWVNRRANFDIVTEREINASTDSGDILYSGTSANDLILQDGFVRYSNGSPINVTSNWVDLLGIPITGPQDSDDDEYDDIPVLADDGMTVITDEVTPEGANGVDSSTNVVITITSGSGTTLNQNSTSQLAISVTENGNPAANKTLSLSVDSNKATISPALGTTNSSGRLSATLTIDRSATPGTFKVSVAIANTDHSATLPITVEVGAGQMSISRSPSTVEPGQSARITFTVRTPGGDLFPGARLSLSATIGNIRPTLVTTDSNGQAKATYTANPYSGTPHPRTISTPRITATVVDNTSVKKDATLTVKYVPSTLSVSGVPSSLESGDSKTITATVRSRSGKAISGVSVTFTESTSYLRFSNSRVNTNSSGHASSTLRTGGQTLGKKITVGVSGISTKTYTIRVKPIIRTTTKSFSDKGNIPVIFKSHKTHDRTKTLSFPGTVVSSTWKSTGRKSKVLSDSISGNKVKVRYVITDGSWLDFGKITVRVTAKYEYVFSTPGAPSLQPQLRPETDQLSAVWQDLSEIPLETALLPNYPNPFNPETWIPYHLAESADVTLSIYAADGRLVRTLALGHQPAGIYENKSRAAYWDGRNTIGERVASGVYFYMLTAGDFTATGKMLIMK